MTGPAQNARLLNHIIVYGFSLAFGLVVASSEALQPTATGFAIALTWWTLLAFVVGTVVMLPCFHVIIYSERKYPRRLALVGIVLLGLGAFFYPMRVVPSEKWRAVFTGLGVAILALSILASMLVLLYRFFEHEDQQGRG